MFFRKKNNTSKAIECEHVWHDVGKYQKRYGDYNGIDTEFYDIKYYVLYCEKCEERKKFTNEEEKNIEYKISQIRENKLSIKRNAETWESPM